MPRGRTYVGVQTRFLAEVLERGLYSGSARKYGQLVLIKICPNSQYSKSAHDVLLQPLLGGRGNGEKCMRCGLARLGVAGMSHNGSEFAG
jgi:hypothetical protein